MDAATAPRLVVAEYHLGQMLGSLTEPPPRIRWAEIWDDEL
jgi:hypothetical protein